MALEEGVEILRSVVPDVFVTSEPVSIVGMPLSSNMTVVRFAAGQLLLHSPVPCSEALRGEVEALGEVRHLYAPNTFHHLWLGEWSEAYPSAKVHAPAALTAKRTELRVDRFHDEGPDAAFADVFDEVHVAGFRLEETLLFHRSSGCLLVADLVHNIGRPPHWWTRIYATLMGFYGRVGLSFAIRSTAFSDLRAARESVTRALELPIEHLLVGHGEPILHDGRAALSTGSSWLLERTDRSKSAWSLPVPGACG